MNRIKVIKRANLPLQPERGETEAKKVEPVTVKRQAAKVTGKWIDEWRASKPKDARRAFADLFNASPSAIG
jgi:hypothetical protein